MILAILFVFGWGITDASFEFFSQEELTFMEKYTTKTKRSRIFALFNFLWLGLRLISICFFANALSRFWLVFRDVSE